MKVRAPDYTPEQLEYLTWYNLNVTYFWYGGVIGMLVLFAFWNAFSRLLSALFVRRFHTLHPSKDSDSGGSSMRCLPSVVLAAYRKWIYRRSQLVVWLGFLNASQFFVFLGYVALTLSLVYSGAYGHPDYSAHHAARLTYAHLPLLVGLASKELGVIGWLTGFSPATLNCLHRWMARTVFFLVCWHIYGRMYTNLPTIAPGHKHLRYQAWGLAGFILWTIMVFGSGRIIRRRFFKTFIFTHIICFCFSIICLALHIPRLGPYLIAAAVVYISDRIFRLTSTVYYNLFKTVGRGVGPSVRVEVVTKDAIKVFITTSQEWTPGKHIYLHAPTFEGGGHPFSISSTFLPVSHLDDDPKPKSGTMVLCVRVHGEGGLTSKLYNHVMEGSEALAYATEESKNLSMPLFPAFTEGPYGHSLLLHRYESVLLITGGTGVTFALPLVLDLVRRARNRHLGSTKPLVTSRVVFVWAVKNRDEVELISDELREAIAYAPPGFLDVQVYVTSGGTSSNNSSIAQLPIRYATSEDSQLEKVEFGTATRVQLGSISEGSTRVDSQASPILEISLSRQHSAGTPAAPTTSTFSPSSHPPSLTPDNLVNPELNNSSISFESTVIPILHGRPRVRDILAEVVSRTPRAGSVAVGTCGPEPLTTDLSNACSDLISVDKVRRGEHRVNVMLHCETFGW
ncbi:hypothetical protein JCM8547_003404 [Rhodosporidiobolus lusitaniae]